MPRLDVAGRRTTREEIYGSRERGHEVSRCERGGCRRLGWDGGTWLAAATTDGASLMEMEEDSCCGHGFISWSRRASAVYMLKRNPPNSKAQAMSFCTLLIPSLFIYTWWYSVKSLLCWGALPGDHISAFGRGRWLDINQDVWLFFILCGRNREHQRETRTAKKHTGVHSHK